MPEGHDVDRLDYPFVGIPSFLRSPIVQDLARLDADVAVMGVPTDEGSPFMPGSRFHTDVIGFDLVEVNPMLGVARAFPPGRVRPVRDHRMGGRPRRADHGGAGRAYP